MALAWDQKKYIKANYSNTASYTENWHEDKTKSENTGYLHHDLKKARALMAEYGKPVELDYLHTATSRGRSADMIVQHMMKEIGIKVNPTPMDFSAIIMPWFTIRKNDPEAMLLARCSGIIPSDRFFWPAFSNRLDELLENNDICIRKKDGYMYFPRELMVTGQYLVKGTMIWYQMQKEGYADHAVDALLNAGFNAWKNSMGDVAVKPPDDSLH